MNDIALSGLTKQLVLAELLTEQSAQQAYQQAQRNRIPPWSAIWCRTNWSRAARSRRSPRSISASPCWTSTAWTKKPNPPAWSAKKLVRQHHALPLWRRGNKLYVGISDPTNHQAINDIQFSTGLTTEAILVEDDKLSDAIEKFFSSPAAPAWKAWAMSTSTAWTSNRSTTPGKTPLPARTPTMRP
nr:hypothetical protein GCM10020185_46340 [Pseudomonas brassicacearum subsp. brassicacearum]